MIGNALSETRDGIIRCDVEFVYKAGIGVREKLNRFPRDVEIYLRVLLGSKCSCSLSIR